jgi:hypothetical protein
MRLGRKGEVTGQQGLHQLVYGEVEDGDADEASPEGAAGAAFLTAPRIMRAARDGCRWLSA